MIEELETNQVYVLARNHVVIRDAFISTIYPYESDRKKLAWCIALFFIISCAFLVMIYGMRFELTVTIKGEDELVKTLGECSDGVDYQTRTDYGKVFMTSSTFSFN